MIAGLVVLGLLGLLALLVWGLSGGWDGLRPQAGPDDGRVVSARRGAGSELDDLAARTAATAGGQPVASVRFDRCAKGQNNFKVRDGYTLRCELTEAVVRRSDGGDVTVTAASLDAALRAAGWSAVAAREMTLRDPQRSVLQQTRSGSYDRGRSRQLLEVVVTSRASSPFVPPLPSGPGVTITGDVAGYRQALDAEGLKVVTLTTVRYFEDS